MKVGTLITTVALTGALWWALPSHAQVLGGGGAGEVAGGVGGALGGAGAQADGSLSGDAQGRVDLDRTQSRVNGAIAGTADRANDARTRAEARAAATRDRLESTEVGVGASASGSSNVDIQDDPSARASGRIQAGASIEQDD